MNSSAKPPIGRPGLGEFIRYHGAWSFGVRMFRSTRFVTRAALVSAVFLVVVAQLAYLYVRTTSQIVDASRQELVGLAYMQQVEELLMRAQKLRHAYQQSSGKPSPALAALMAQVEKDLTDLRAADSIGMAEQMKFLQDAFEPMRKPAEDADEAFNRADMFAAQVLRLAAAAADRSGLSMDPDESNHHLILASSVDTLQSINTLGRLRDVGVQVLVAGSATAAQRNLLQGDSYVMYRALEDLFARYELATLGSVDLAKNLAVEEALKPANVFMRTLRKGPLAETVTASDGAALDNAAQAALTNLSTLARATFGATHSAIEARILAQQTARNIQLGFVAAALGLTVYLFYCFYLVTRGGMDEITRHVKAMAQGDLTTTPRPWGKDEAADLMLALAEMQVSMRNLVGHVGMCSQNVLVASTEVATGGQDLSQRTEQAASNLQETASAIAQISSAFSHTADNVNATAALGRDNALAAARGAEVISQVVSTMGAIQVSSRKVSDITSVIDGIAFQTNILALNAAVEAARAGEQGRGFAVVAGEVRTLAQRSAAAAREIKTLIQASTEQVDQGTQVVRTAGDTMAQLQGNAQKMSALLLEVSKASVDQSRGVTEVSGAVTRLDEDTQRNAALVEQTSAAATSLQQMASELAETAARFRLPEAEAT